MSDKLQDLMARRGYEPIGTGGGCKAWQRMDGDVICMVSAESSLGSFAARYEQVWLATRYSDEGGYYEWKDEVTLDQALTIIEFLPDPEGDEQVTIGSWADMKHDGPVWLREFSDRYRPDQSVLDLLRREGVGDQSWHNDTKPHFVFERADHAAVEFWFDAEEREDREMQEAPRYQVFFVPACIEEDRRYENAVEESEDAASCVAKFIELIEALTDEP